MKTAALRNKQRTLRLFLFCFIFLAVALAATIADAASFHREFWVRDLGSTTKFRKAHATLHASGQRSLIYVEDRIFGHDLNNDYIERLETQLETAVPAPAFINDVGLVPLEERLFHKLSTRISQDDRVIVLFADLGKDENSRGFDGFFNSFDQLRDFESMLRYKQHSNEANLIYVNGYRKNDAYTTGVIARELQHLLSYGTTRESWLSESMAEGAMLLAGIFTDQPFVDRALNDTGAYPLVTPSTVEYGPQLLFASFLIDTLPMVKNTPLSALDGIERSGRDAVEELFARHTDVPLTFDAVFSNFVSYIFGVTQDASLPSSWRHSPGIRIPQVASFFTYRAGSGELSATLAPYSFVAIDLAQALSPSAIISVKRVTPPGATSTHCSDTASVLWKPVSATRLAVYAVGCDPSDQPEFVQFRLKILDQPSLLPAGPFKLLR